VRVAVSRGAREAAGAWQGGGDGAGGQDPLAPQHLARLQRDLQLEAAVGIPELVALANHGYRLLTFNYGAPTRRPLSRAPATSRLQPGSSHRSSPSPVQNQCPLDQSDHLQIAYDPVAMADMLNALDRASPVQLPCVPVLPITGPVGWVPSF
jgi:hypothetical protein